jgi:hypothetical protein
MTIPTTGPPDPASTTNMTITAPQNEIPPPAGGTHVDPWDYGPEDEIRTRFFYRTRRLYALTFKHFEDLRIGDAPTFAQVADLGYGCF